MERSRSSTSARPSLHAEASAPDTSRPSASRNVRSSSTTGDVVDDEFRAMARAAQSLASTLNDPLESDAERKRWLWGLAESFESEWQPLQVIPRPDLPHVEFGDFRRYIARMSSLLEEFQENHSGIFAIDSTNNSSAHGHSIREAQREVPGVFFHEDFTLHDLDVFESYCLPTRSDYLLTQERLVHFSDRVEAALRSEISSRADGFLEAVQELRNLQEEVTEALDSVRQVRHSMRRLDQTAIEGSLRVSQLQREQQNMNEVAHLLSSVVQVVQEAKKQIDDAARDGDYSGALALIRQAREAIDDAPEGLECLQSIRQQLDEIEENIGDMASTDFTHLCFGGSALVDDIRLGSDLSDEPLPVEDEDIRQLNLIIGILLRNGGLSGAMEAFKETLMKETKVFVKTVVSRCISPMESAVQSGADGEDSQQRRPSALVEKLRAISNEDFITILLSMFVNLRRIIARIRIVFGHIASAVERERARNSSEEDQSEVLTMKELRGLIDDALSAMCDIAQARAARVTSVSELARIVDACASFIYHVDSVAAVNAVALRNAATAMSRTLLGDLHKTKLERLNGLLDHEDWTQKEVSGRIQMLVEKLQPSASLKDSHRSENGNENGNSSREKLTVSEQEYCVCGTVQMLLQDLDEYLEIAALLPALARDVLPRICELLKTFNVRSCELVLGAGAMQIAGLKRITAKHLALASQCLGAMIAHGEHLRDALASHMEDRERILLEELDNVLKDIRQHRHEIFVKLINIMRDRIDYHTRGVGLLPWNAPIGGTLAPHDYIVSLVKETYVLHNTLSSMVEEEHYNFVVRGVFKAFNAQLTAAYSQLDISNDAGKRRLMADIDHLTSSLRKFMSIDVGHALEDFVATRFGRVR